jgi:hypothetical protein
MTRTRQPPAPADRAEDGKTQTPGPQAVDGKDQGPSQAAVLVSLAEERFRLLMGEDGQPYAVFKDGPNLALSLRGRGSLRRQLAALYTDRSGGKVPSASALTDALTVLEGRAEVCGIEPISLRVGQVADAVVLDLGTADGSCVVARPGQWRVCQVSPILFRRSRATGPLPVPAGPGSLEGLRDLVNVDDDGWWLIVGWLVAALIPGVPHPILALFGLQGTAKSTATKMLVKLIDPSGALTRTPPKDVKTWAITANAHWVTGLDNLSAIAGWFSDALCRAVTGEGIEERALYSDDDVNIIAFRRVIVVNGIDAGNLAGDVAERMVTIELDRITPDKRAEEVEIWNAFDACHPTALAGLLDLLVKVLKVLPEVRLAVKPRMADFARVLAAVDQVTGQHTLESFYDSADTAQESVVNADTFALAVKALAERTLGGWTGSPTSLLDELTPTDPFGSPRAPDREWPKSVKAMTGRLKRVLPALESVGVLVEFSRSTGHDRARLVTIRQSDESPQNPSDPSDPSDTPHHPSSTALSGPDGSSDGSSGPDGSVRRSVRHPSDENPSSGHLSYGSDGSDGLIQLSSAATPPCRICQERMDRIYQPDGAHPWCLETAAPWPTLPLVNDPT